jgi:hypothetical protein
LGLRYGRANLFRLDKKKAAFWAAFLISSMKT